VHGFNEPEVHGHAFDEALPLLASQLLGAPTRLGRENRVQLDQATSPRWRSPRRRRHSSNARSIVDIILSEGRSLPSSF
jgi:hypothetical protein